MKVRFPWRGLAQSTVCASVAWVVAGGRPWGAYVVLVAVVALATLGLHVSRQAWVLLAMIAALAGIARTTGSGWMVALMVGLAATLVVAALLSVVATGGVGLRIEAPPDATATRPARLRVAVTGRGRG
ncbi:MAG: hypothetical protein H0U89_03970, partial [Acidimicrobiia bacterium]|nr:hypothetical protein [Acidimicrobiia bacterium]